MNFIMVYRKSHQGLALGMRMGMGSGHLVLGQANRKVMMSTGDHGFPLCLYSGADKDHGAFQRAGGGIHEYS